MANVTNQLTNSLTSPLLRGMDAETRRAIPLDDRQLWNRLSSGERATINIAWMLEEVNRELPNVDADIQALVADVLADLAVMYS